MTVGLLGSLPYVDVSNWRLLLESWSLRFRKIPSNTTFRVPKSPTRVTSCRAGKMVGNMWPSLKLTATPPWAFENIGPTFSCPQKRKGSAFSSSNLYKFDRSKLTIHQGLRGGQKLPLSPFFFTPSLPSTSALPRHYKPRMPIQLGPSTTFPQPEKLITKYTSPVTSWKNFPARLNPTTKIAPDVCGRFCFFVGLPERWWKSNQERSLDPSAIFPKHPAII